MAQSLNLKKLQAPSEPLNGLNAILTRDDRLETVAADIVHHFIGRGFVGKAMVVSIDKATALRLHDKVRKYWAKETEKTKAELKRLSDYQKSGDNSVSILNRTGHE